MNVSGGLSTLLDEALGLGLQNPNTVLPHGRVILIKDCVETSGAFVLHHLIKHVLVSQAANTHSNPPGAVLFVALAEPFSHYERILRKLGCNLLTHKDNNRFFFFDLLQLECQGGDRGNIIEGGLFELYGKIQRAVESSASSKYEKGGVTIIIDDVSLLEIAAYGSVEHVLAFLHYCHTLTSDLGCSLVLLNHQDIYSSIQSLGLISQMDYLADVVVRAEPLATGLAADVHGQLTVLNKGVSDDQANLGSRIHRFHFKLKENNVEYFIPGTQI